MSAITKIHPNWYQDLLGGFWANLGPYHAGFVAIDPKTAAVLLDHHNKKNRRPVQSQIDMICADMIAGNWKVTGETLIFDDERNCINGQNRLYAGVRSNKTFDTFVIVGVAPDAFKVLDQQSKRNAGQILNLMGEKNSTALASAITFLKAMIETGEVDRHGAQKASLSVSSRIDCLAEYPDIRQSAITLLENRKTMRMFRSVGLPIAIHYLTTFSKPLVAKVFWRGLMEYSLPEDVRYDGARKLTKKLLDNLSDQSKLPLRAIAALLIKSWNACSANEQVKNLSFSGGKEEFPTIDGLKYQGGKIIL